MFLFGVSVSLPGDLDVRAMKFLSGISVFFYFGNLPFDDFSADSLGFFNPRDYQ